MDVKSKMTGVTERFLEKSVFQKYIDYRNIDSVFGFIRNHPNLILYR